MDDDRDYGLEFALLHHEFGTHNMENSEAPELVLRSITPAVLQLT